MTDSEPGSARRGIGAALQRTSASASGTSTDDKTTSSTTVSRTGSTSARERSTGEPRSAPERARRESATGAAATGTSTKTKAQPAAATARRVPVRKPRRAQLRLSQIDAWSVTKTAFLLSIALGIVTVVAVGIIWGVLGAAGVFDSLNSTVQTVMGNSFRVQDYIGTGRVLGFTMLLAVVDVFLLTAIATLTAFLYNLAAILLGGVELTLTEDG